jgi:hypothetical protein
MLQIINKLSEEEASNLLAYIKELPLKREDSKANRNILWINNKPSLLEDNNLSEVYIDTKLGDLCKDIFPWCEYILVTDMISVAHSGVNWHIDPYYCADLTGTINLGPCKLGTKQADIEEWTFLEVGDIVTFNSKILHCAIPCCDHRYAIHCWGKRDVI